MLRILAILPFLWAGAAFAAGPVFDVHVHLHDGEESLLAYEAKAMVVLTDNANILPGDSEKLFNLVVRVPETKFILAHIGGLNFRFWNVLALARTADGFAMDNLYFDISGPVLLAADSPIEAEFVWTLRSVGIDHVLLGSDYPQMGLDDAVDALEKLDLTDEEKAKIRAGNARKLLGRQEKA